MLCRRLHARAFNIMRLQELIHKIEVEEGGKIYRLTAIVLGLILLAVLYDLREYKNWSNGESMDAAQLARNISEGQGFTTQNIRPLSMHLVARYKERGDPQIENHPDLANPPLYPALLALYMKVMPMNFQIDNPANFEKYDPEFKIVWLNQGIFFLCIYLAYLLGRRLFEPSIGWVAAFLLGGTDLLWRYSTSGLPTMLLMLLFLLLLHVMVSIEKQAHPEAETDAPGPDGMKPDPPQVEKSGAWFFGMAASAGLIVGLGFLTRYSFAIIAIPVIYYFLRHHKGRRLSTFAAFSMTFLVVAAPWMIRNTLICGIPTGTAGLMIASGTYSFPGDTLERSLTPDLSLLQFRDFTHKLMLNSADIITSDLPALGGNWISALFLGVLFVQFKSHNLRRIRNMVALSVFFFVLAQAVGLGYQNVLSPELNGQKLLIVLAPALFIFGAAMVSILMDHMVFPFPEFRVYVVLALGVVLCIPMIIKVLPPRTYPIAYPPYFPPIIQSRANWMGEDELIMSDIPWAMAWYGDRMCIQNTKVVEPDFYTINDYIKPVRGLFLSPLTTDQKMASEALRNDQGWANFALNLLVKTNYWPAGFPLTSAPVEGLPEHLFLTDWERWSGPQR